MEKQVNREHYHFMCYMNKPRWYSYWHQIDEVLRTNPKSVLIIGTGDNILQKILIEYIPVVKVLDIDAELLPDYVGSVSECSKIVDQSFDCVVCCQVLEHLPLVDFERCLQELKKITLKHCIISLPQKRWAWSFKLVLFNRILQLGWVHTRSNINHKFDGQHYWELGASGASKSYIQKLLSSYFIIDRNYSPLDNTYHRFYILKAGL